MNTKLLLIALVVAGLCSCNTAYKLQQTPDDVYYSPAPQQNDYVQVNNDADRNVYNNASPEDREIYRHINNRRWRRLHGYDYGYDYPYNSGYYPYGYNNYPVYADPKTGTVSAPRKYDMGSYRPPVTNYTIDPKTGKVIIAPNNSVITSAGTPARTFTRPQINTGSGVGNLIRKVFSSSNTSTSTLNNNTTQSRSFDQTRTNNNNNSSSSVSPRSTGSSSSGGNAPVRTFNK